MLTVSRGLMADLARDVLDRDARVSFVVHGRSMLPVLLDGDRVTVAPLDHKPRPGELLALSTPHGLMVHRLVAYRSDGSVITAGDNVDHRDAPRSLSDVLGIVECVTRNQRSWEVGRDRRALWSARTRRAIAALRRRVLRIATRRSEA